MPYQDFARKYLTGRERDVRMNQISPKVFEAIRLRTALVLFEGRYSGIVAPDLHYIPLKKDFSNFDEVVQKLESLDYIEALTDRAYRDIIESGRWSYKAFAEDFSKYLSRRLVGRRPRARIVSTPVVAFQANPSLAELWPHGLMNGLANSQILDARLGKDQVLAAIGGFAKAERATGDLKRRHEWPKPEWPTRATLTAALRFWAQKVPGARRVVHAYRRFRAARP